jgi:hypothetical protein
MGYTETPGLYSFTGQARQTWIKTHYSPTDAPHMYYSPLFVDLVDTYNQHNINSSYNNDSISIGPYIHTIIREIAAQCKTWDDMKNALDDYVGVFYTQTQFDSFCMPYNYWYEHI